MELRRGKSTPGQIVSNILPEFQQMSAVSDQSGQHGMIFRLIPRGNIDGIQGHLKENEDFFTRQRETVVGLLEVH